MIDPVSHYYFTIDTYDKFIFLVSNLFTHLSIDRVFVHIIRSNNTRLSFDATPPTYLVDHL